MKKQLVILSLLLATHVLAIENSTASSRYLLERPRLKSQVLTLNLSNLIFLALLKLALVGPGFGSTSMYRRMDGQKTDDLKWAAAYLWSSNTDHYDCLYQMACKDPERADKYVAAAKTMHKVFTVTKKLFPSLPKYDVIVNSVHEAAEFGKTKNKECIRKYNCTASPFKT